MMPGAIHLRRLQQAVRDGKLAVEVCQDINWIFLRKPGFTLAGFGDVETRDRFLGKWIADFPAGEVGLQAQELLPLVHAGVVKLAKLTNTINRRRETAVIAVYCLERDAVVLAALAELGWNPRWKYNYETFRQLRKKRFVLDES